MFRGPGQEGAPWKEMGCGCEALGKAFTFSGLSFFMFYDWGLSYNICAKGAAISDLL